MKILFVCLGNICRSPMAEMIMRHLLTGAGNENGHYIESAATSDEETGNPIYPPAKTVLCRHGIPITDHRARRIEKGDYDKFDLIVGMEEANIRSMIRYFGADRDSKIKTLLSFTGTDGDISDPWYTGDFEKAYDDILRGCTALLESLH